MCNGKHPTTLHGYIRKGTKNNDQQEKESKEETKGIACSSVNAFTNVISMCVVSVKLQHKESGKTIETFALLDSCSQGTFVVEKF